MHSNMHGTPQEEDAKNCQLASRYFTQSADIFRQIISHCLPIGKASCREFLKLATMVYIRFQIVYSTKLSILIRA